MNKRDDEVIADELRRRAEERVREQTEQGGAIPSPEDALRILHELQVHQIELEMQNEELMRARADLELALQSYAELYDFAPVGYLTLGDGGTIERVNLTGARLLGIERSRLVGRRLAALIANPSLPTFNATFDEALARQGEASCQVELPRAEDESRPRWVEITVSASRVPCTAILADVTERRRTEEQVRASQKMEAIGRLAGGVAHDFNNILTVIQSHAELALDTLPADGAAREDVESLKAAAEHAAALTRQLLAFGRKQIIQPEVVDVNALARDLARLLARLLGEDVELVLALDEGIGRVKVDPSQLEQVIMNLAVNARDAMPEGGTLTITTANGSSDASGNATVLITVSDDGVGMDKATAARIFEPFFTTKEKGRGTGFGLSTVYGIVQQCGGSIAFRSELGRGTTFQITLPRCVMPATPPEAQKHVLETSRRSDETILVVEDEPALRRVAERILTAAGYKVLLAKDGEDALRICQEYPDPIDLALSDVLMPKMSGLVLAERLEQLRPTTAILLMSGYAADGQGGLAAIDVTRFIGKPFTAGALTRKVRELLDQRAKR